VELVHADSDPQRPDLFNVWMPWIDAPLEALLDSPTFTPWDPPFSRPHFNITDESNTLSLPYAFVQVVRSLAYQLLSALAHLHTRGIAHRDVKPGNIRLARDGQLVLIDFGIAYQREACASADVMWPEAPGSLYTQVGTG
jgi:serine/threonine protein kinase